MTPRSRAIGLLVLVAACAPDAPSVTTALTPFPPQPSPPAFAGSLDAFAGAEACNECHADQYRAWAASTHGRAGGVPTPGMLIAPFDGQAIRFRDAEVTPVSRAGGYAFIVRQEGLPEQVYDVVGVIGRGHMLGGGTQGFLTRLDDGTERFLPWDWSDDASEWFCNTGSRLDAGWLPIHPEMRLRDCGDWPPIRPIGTTSRFANCQECHGSQIRTAFDPTERRYDTQYTTLRVNCESCHGPGVAHIEWARSGANGLDIGLESLAWRDKDTSLQVCFQCHALKDVLAEGYLPGDPFLQAFALKFPVLGDEPYTVDGRVRSFAYQANHLASACYLQGPMDCVSCHEPHGQGYWDVNRRALASPFDDGQCTACHESKAIDPQSHTRHPVASDGARCVSCHMPYLQHPEVGSEIPFARSDHTIAIPRPTFDDSIGIVGACAGCHEDRTSAELEVEVAEGWGATKPHRPLVTGQMEAAAAGSVDAAAELLLRPEEVDPLLQFQALSRFVIRHLDPDAPPSEEVVSRLRALAIGPDLDVRALALAALHWTAGDDPDVRTFLVDALARGDDGLALRGRWALALGFLGDQNREQGSLRRAQIAYEKALEIRGEDPKLLTNLGLLHTQSGSLAEAVRAFQRSLAIEPNQPLTQVNLGIALETAGDPAGSRAAYEAAVQLNPHEALGYFNLGNFHQRGGRLEEAVAAYGNAIRSDPGLGRAYFELARSLILLERAPEALPFARRAAEFMPDHGPSRQMLADLVRAFGGA